MRNEIISNADILHKNRVSVNACIEEKKKNNKQVSRTFERN